MSGASVILLDADPSEQRVALLRERLAAAHPAPHVARGDGWAALATGGVVDGALLEDAEGVRAVINVDTPYRIASRALLDGAGTVNVSAGIALGGASPIGVIAGSRWAGGSEVRLAAIAPLLTRAGCAIVHVGAPFAKGAGAATSSVRALRDIAHEHGLGVSVEVASAAEITDAIEVADLLQVGSHNMQDFNLLRELGACTTPVLLKRGPGATVEEFLLAAEYVLSHGNGRVILCEAGIRTFDALAKPRFEINAIALLKQLTHLPVIADPSRCAPSSSAVPALARAAIAAGADGVLLDVGTETIQHPDGAVIGTDTLQRLVADLRPIARAVGRVLPARGGDTTARVPLTPDDVLHSTERTLSQVIESVLGAPPLLDVIDQWRIQPAQTPTALTPPFDPADTILARCTGYRTGELRLSRNLAFVDLDRIDPTLGALLESEQLNLGQLFVDPRITKLAFTFGTDADAGDIDQTLQRCFPGDDLGAYLWRRYHAAIDDRVVFVVIETLPLQTWDVVLRGVSPAPVAAS